jgi:hypothetical protein
MLPEKLLPLQDDGREHAVSLTVALPPAAPDGSK